MTHPPGRLRFEHEHVVTDDERFEAGRLARTALRRTDQALYVSDPNRDPLGVLDQQHAARLPNLVPLRIERMAQDPFAFYRGTAAIQAADLASQPTTGAGVVLCGDAHIANFGIFASPERTLVFDLNDFDEAGFGPWEWDVKRLVTSVVIAGRQKGFDEAAVLGHARTAALSYSRELHEGLKLNGVDRFFVTSTLQSGLARNGPETRKVLKRAVAAASKRTSSAVVSKITELAPDGSRHIVEDPPTLTHLTPELESLVGEVFERYLTTVSGNIALLLSQHTITDVARRVVGVGSVGTRCFILVLTGPKGHPLVLQLKEAGQSVLHEFGGVPYLTPLGKDPEEAKADHGFRVVSSQRVLQAASDPFLGWFSLAGFHYYVRQFRDRNLSFDIATMSDQVFDDYVRGCARALARAHVRSPNGAFIAGYLGRGTKFADAVVTWSLAYADQSLADFELLREAAASGRYAISDETAPAESAE